MQVCGFVVVVFNNSLYPLFVLMHASLDFSACSCSCLSLYLQDRMMSFKRYIKVKSIFLTVYFNTLVQILKASIIEWETCVCVCVYLYVYGGWEGDPSGADTGITLTI